LLAPTDNMFGIQQQLLEIRELLTL